MELGLFCEYYEEMRICIVVTIKVLIIIFVAITSTYIAILTTKTSTLIQKSIVF